MFGYVGMLVFGMDGIGELYDIFFVELVCVEVSMKFSVVGVVSCCCWCV